MSHLDGWILQAKSVPFLFAEAVGQERATSHLSIVKSKGGFNCPCIEGAHSDQQQADDQHRHRAAGKGVNRCAVRAPVVDLEEPEGESKWGFVSGYKAGLRHRHDRPPKSKESQIRALEKAVTNTAVQN